MKMKKAICLSMMAAMMMGCLSACGGETAEQTTTVAEVTEQAAVDTEEDISDNTEEATEAATEAAASDTDSTDKSDSNASASVDGDITEEEYSKMTAEDLLAHVKDLTSVTKEEYLWLISTYRFAKIVDEESDAYNIYTEKCITDEALNSIEYDAKPEFETYVDDLLNSEYPQVRAYGISRVDSLFGVSDANLTRAKELLKTEDDTYVLHAALVSLANKMNEPEIAEFIYRMADSDNVKLRVRAACAIGNSWSQGVDGAVDKIIEMMNDENADVREAACKYSGKLADEAVIDPLLEILNNDAEVDLHGACLEGLITMWYDYPLHRNHSERAYNETMTYFKKTPRTEDDPYWAALSSLTHLAESAADEWKANSPYYDPDDIYNTMVDIIQDENASYLARTSAIKVAKTHGTEDQFASLKSVVDGLTDGDASLIQKSYEKEAEAE